ncbi:hypothetical protein [Rhizobium leguminosarum]|nr:hypothetical protein [Rhizobium leguminosarum]
MDDPSIELWPPGPYLTATLSAIVNGHKQGWIEEMLPWNRSATM